MKNFRFPARAVYAFAVAALCLGFFLHSVELRRPGFGRLDGNADCCWRSLTRASLGFADNWYREGIVNLRGALVHNPYSIEFQGWRDLYLSYPAGFVLPIYLASYALADGPTVELVMGYSLLNHGLVTLVLALGVFFLFLRLGAPAWQAGLAGAVTGLQQVYLVGPFLWYQNTWFADIAAPLPFLCIALAETFRYLEPSRRKALDRLLWFLFAWGLFTDWLVFFLLAVVLVFRWGEAKRQWWKEGALLLSAAAPTVLHFLVLHFRYDVWERILGRMEERTGSAWRSILTHYFPELAVQYGPAGPFGLAGLALLLLALVYFRFRHPRSRVQPDLWAAVRFGLLLTVPILGHLLVLQNHYSYHPYTGLKFSLLISGLVFTLVPFAALRAWFPRWASAWILLVPLAAYNVWLNQREFYAPPPDAMVPREHLVCDFLTKHSIYEEVVFSPTISTSTQLGRGQSHQANWLGNSCRKVVYEAADFSDVSRHFEQFRNSSFPPLENGPEIMVSLLFEGGEPTPEWRAFLKGKPATRVVEGNLLLVRLSGRLLGLTLL